MSNNQIVNTEYGFKKLHVADTVAFASENIPTVDKPTLEKFLQLIHTTGTFGLITHRQIVNKMRLTLKYVPNACPHSLLVIAELLELKTSTLSKSPPATLPDHLNGSRAGAPRIHSSRPLSMAG